MFDPSQLMLCNASLPQVSSWVRWGFSGWSSFLIFSIWPSNIVFIGLDKHTHLQGDITMLLFFTFMRPPSHLLVFPTCQSQDWVVVWIRGVIIGRYKFASKCISGILKCFKCMFFVLFFNGKLGYWGPTQPILMEYSMIFHFWNCPPNFSITWASF